MRKAITIALAGAILSATLAGCGNATTPSTGTTQSSDQNTKASVTLNLGHALSEGTPASEGIKDFAAAVAEKTDGRVAIEVFPNSMLGSETEMLEQMKIGQLEAAAIMVGSMQSLDMKMAIEDLPYMWKDKQSARDAYDGEFGEYLGEIMQAQGLKKISYIEWGFRHITNNVRPISTPEDMKGMSIRVAQTKLRVEAFETLGALPTIMAFSELYGALQQGVVDAQENPLANIVASNFNEVQKYLSLTEHFYNTVMMVFDENVWAKISPEDQAVILEEAQNMSVNVRAENDIAEQGYIDELKSRGMNVNEEVDKDAFRQAMLPVYDKWEKDVFGEELMTVYRNASGW